MRLTIPAGVVRVVGHVLERNVFSLALPDPQCVRFLEADRGGTRSRDAHVGQVQ